MPLLTMNDTPRAGQAATQITEHCHELHRGAMRCWPATVPHKLKKKRTRTPETTS